MANTKHGMRQLPEYRIWVQLHWRCRQGPSSSEYGVYGGRGIGVCSEWDEFATFYRDMGPRPSPQHTIDRVDNSLGYSPSNCRWATKVQQARNRRSNVLITFGSRTQTIADWAEETGLSYVALRYRLKRGWPVERALREPVQSRVYTAPGGSRG